MQQIDEFQVGSGKNWVLLILLQVNYKISREESKNESDILLLFLSVWFLAAF